MSLTREQKQEARLLRARNPRFYSWARLGTLYGVHAQTVHRAVDIGFAIERCRQWKERWHNRRKGATA